MNFIFASLCDNDFNVVEALRVIHERAEHQLTESEYKFFIINYLVYFSSIRRVNRIFMHEPEHLVNTREYLETKLKVQFLDKKPEVDHDYGSAVLDTHTGEVFPV
jgi:hypothetical protein